MNLRARPGCLGQTPLAAAAPVTIVSVHRANRRAHRGYLADARLVRSSPWHVDRDCEVHQRDRGQHQGHLADADRTADAAILRRYHQVLHRHWFRHPASVGLITQSVTNRSSLYSRLFILCGRKCLTDVLRRINMLFIFAWIEMKPTMI